MAPRVSHGFCKTVNRVHARLTLLVSLLRFPQVQNARLAIVVMVAGGVVLVLSIAYGLREASTESNVYEVSFGTVSTEDDPIQGVVTVDNDVSIGQAVHLQSLNMVFVCLSWTDNSMSPLSDPAVMFEVTPANLVDAEGNPVAPKRTSVPPGGGCLYFVVNELPPNRTVEASSGQEAIDLASASSIDSHAGSGEWEVLISAASARGEKLHPAASVSYTLEFRYQTIVGTAAPYREAQ